MHDLPLITTIAAGFTAAWVLGLLAQKLGLSPIVGYLLAGVVIGPYTPGYAGNIEIAHQLAEVGVMLLMFGVGLHFHVKDLLAVKGVAVPGAVVQSLMATIAAMFIFHWLGIPYKSGAVIGMAMAVASTVVLMRVLMDADSLNSPPGHVAVGWLIVEDIFTVILLVLIPVLGTAPETAEAAHGALNAAHGALGSGAERVVQGGADLAHTALGGADAAAAHTGEAHGGGGDRGLWAELGIALAKLAALVFIVLVGGARVVPWVLVRVARLRSRELFTLTVLVFSIAIATGSYYFFGASMALGAFLAGMVVAQSSVSHQAAADALPMRDAFAVLFFVSVGMIFDPRFLLQEPLMVLAALGIILIVKPLAALFIVAVLGYSARTALTVALGLAQIGEFSFILSELARKHGLMPDAGHNVLVASAIISITLNPLLFRSLPRIESWARRRPLIWAMLNSRAERRARRTNQAAAEDVASKDTGERRVAVVIGFGPVGRSVHTLLRDAGMTTVVIDMNLDTVSALNRDGQPAIFGDASHESILEQAGAKSASHVVVTLPSASDRGAVVAAIRHLNPGARILVRARYLREREELEQAGATVAVFEEAEAAVALARVVLADTGVNREAADQKVRDLRLNLITENMSHIRTQRVRTVMVAWTRVRRLTTSMTKEEVLRQLVAHRYSRWPVVEEKSGRATGYLLAKDMVANEAADGDWRRFVRPLHAIGPEENVASVLARMQSEGATVYVVEEAGRPLGMITLEDIIEQVVGRIEDEYPHRAVLTLADAVAAGGIALNVQGRTHTQVIKELAGMIPPERVPPGVDVGALAIEREADMSTDLGMGVAIPHARCPGLRRPVIVFGRSKEGVLFSPRSGEVVRLIFLLVTPTEEPEVQLALLGQLARLAGDESKRERLLHAGSIAEVMELLTPMIEREGAGVR